MHKALPPLHRSSSSRRLLLGGVIVLDDRGWPGVDRAAKSVQVRSGRSKQLVLVRRPATGTAT